MDFAWVFPLFLSLTVLLDIVHSARDKNMYCGACLVMVDEMNYSILSTDPRKKLQVGSFRVDSRGNQGTYEVPLARSELHLQELLEKVCEGMNSYAQSIHQESGRYSFVRTSSRNGQPVTLKHITMNSKISESLRFACETLIEEHEEDLIKLFKNPEADVEKEICMHNSGFCDEKDVEIFKELQKAAPEPEDEKKEDKEETNNDKEQSNDKTSEEKEEQKDNTNEEKEENREEADNEDDKEELHDITDELLQNAKTGQPDMSEILKDEL